MRRDMGRTGHTDDTGCAEGGARRDMGRTGHADDAGCAEGGARRGEARRDMGRMGHSDDAGYAEGAEVGSTRRSTRRGIRPWSRGDSGGGGDESRRVCAGDARPVTLDRSAPRQVRALDRSAPSTGAP